MEYHKWVILRALTHRLAAVIPRVPLPLVPRPLVPLLVTDCAGTVTHGMPIQAVAGASNVISSHSHHERDSVLHHIHHKDAIVTFSVFSFVLVTINLL